MATSDDPPLDEIQWRSLHIAQSMGGIHTDSVLHYFSHSPFYDATSNNANLMTQAAYNPNMSYVVQTREAFEKALKSMQGLEFMVTQDPSNNGRQAENSGIWVIRKQTRRKRSGQEDEITGLSSYFIIGENIYMAPSVGNILGSRMLSIVTSLTKMLSTASSLPNFTPSQGHTYLPSMAKAVPVAGSVQMSQVSKESTPMPDTQGTGKSSKNSVLSEKASTFDLRNSSILLESLNLYQRYGNEYMDESPLVGEPGSFVLQKPREGPSQPHSVPSQPSSQSQLQSQDVPVGRASATPTPAPLKTDIPPLPNRKGNKGGEKTPITPGLKDKKGRRKSKVAGAMTTTTPK